MNKNKIKGGLILYENNGIIGTTNPSFALNDNDRKNRLLKQITETSSIKSEGRVSEGKVSEGKVSDTIIYSDNYSTSYSSMKKYKINYILDEIFKIQEHKSKIDKIKIIRGSEYKKKLFLDNLDNYFNIDNIFHKNYDLINYINSNYINDIVSNLNEYKEKKIDILSIIQLLKNQDKRRSRSRSKSLKQFKSMGGREIRNKIKGGSSLKPYGVKLLKCLNIFDAKHDFFKINKSGEHLKKYISDIGNNKIANIFFNDAINQTKFHDFFTNNDNYESSILYEIFFNIEKYLENNINISNFSFIEIPTPFNNELNLKKYDTDLTGNTTSSSFNNGVNNLIEYINNFFKYKDKNKCKYIFDTNIKIHKDLQTIIKENIDDDDDDDDYDDEINSSNSSNSLNPSNPSITINLYNKIGKHIKPFENAFDPHSSNEIIIENQETYTLYQDILNKNFNDNFNHDDEAYHPINKTTSDNFSFHIFPVFTSNSKNYFPCIKLKKPISNQNDFIQKISKYLNLPTIPQNKIFIKDTNDDDYLYFDQNDIYIVYKNSFNTIRNINTAIKSFFSIKTQTDLDNFIRDVNKKFCNNNVLNIIIHYLLYIQTQSIKISIIYNIIDILLDFKKAGDWGQSLFCSKYNTNSNNRNNNCFFISGDQLSAARSILCGNVNTIFSYKSELGLFQANNINTFQNFHNFIKDNIYNHEIFEKIFTNYSILINNEKFYAIDPSPTPINKDTIITPININYKKLYNLIIILKYITLQYLSYNAVIKYDEHGNIIKDENPIQFLIMNRYIHNFDLSSSSSSKINLNELLNTPRFLTEQQIQSIFLKEEYLKENTNHTKLFDSFIKDFNDKVFNEIKDENREGDLYLYVNAFLKFIDLINIYKMLICCYNSKLHKRTFIPIIRHKQIEYVDKIKTFLIKLDNYSSDNKNYEDFEYSRLDYYIEQIKLNDVKTTKLQTFKDLLITYIDRINEVVGKNNKIKDVIIYYNNIVNIINNFYTYYYYWINLKNDTDDEKINIYKYIKNFLINYVRDANNKKEETISNISIKTLNNKLKPLMQPYIQISEQLIITFLRDKCNDQVEIINDKTINIKNINNFFDVIIDLINELSMTSIQVNTININLAINILKLVLNINNNKIFIKTSNIIKHHNEFILFNLIKKEIFQGIPGTPTIDKKYIHELFNLLLTNKKLLHSQIYDLNYDQLIIMIDNKIKSYRDNSLTITELCNTIKFRSYKKFIIKSKTSKFRISEIDGTINTDNFIITKELYQDYDKIDIKLLNLIVIIPYIISNNLGIRVKKEIVDDMDDITTNIDIDNSNYHNILTYLNSSNIEIPYDKLYNILLEFVNEKNQKNKRKISDDDKIINSISGGFGRKRRKQNDGKKKAVDKDAAEKKRLQEIEKAKIAKIQENIKSSFIRLFEFLKSKYFIDMNELYLYLYNKSKYEFEKLHKDLNEPDKNKIYGYEKQNINEMKEFFKEYFTKDKINEQEEFENNANFIGISATRRRQNKTYTYFSERGIRFLIENFSKLPFKSSIVSKSFDFKYFFKYISLNMFIIQELFAILNASNNEIFDLMKRNFQIFDGSQINKISEFYYNNDIYNETHYQYEKDFIKIIDIFLRGVVVFLDNEIKKRKGNYSNYDYIMNIYNADDSKKLKNVLSKLDFMIKYTN